MLCVIVPIANSGLAAPSVYRLIFLGRRLTQSQGKSLSILWSPNTMSRSDIFAKRVEPPSIGMYQLCRISLELRAVAPDATVFDDQRCTWIELPKGLAKSLSELAEQ